METLNKSENTIFRKGPVIFVVTGTQAPFDRLLSIIDKWAVNQDTYSVIAQTANSEINFKNMTCFDYLEPDVFNEYFNNADVIIGHAGMGTIIKALENKKKLVVFPRLVKYNEHRNDHQHHTAFGFEKLGLINVAYNEKDLFRYLNNIIDIPVKRKINQNAEKQLLEKISNFINK
jgi:UDP-N-acetylglucosamine transferase subunit ALG13|tara:strand:- start:109 stop:633 length:525 start_codon:yes stop_codon:yes gene_type:complete